MKHHHFYGNLLAQGVHPYEASPFLWKLALGVHPYGTSPFLWKLASSMGSPL